MPIIWDLISEETRHQIIQMMPDDWAPPYTNRPDITFKPNLVFTEEVMKELRRPPKRSDGYRKVG